MRKLYRLVAILLFFWVKDDLKASHIHDVTSTLVSDITFFDTHGFAKIDHRYSMDEYELAHTLSACALIEQQNRCQFSEWDLDNQNHYASDWFIYLSHIKEYFSYMPGVSQIIIGELNLILNAEQKKPFQQLLDKPLQFTEYDVWLFLENANIPRSINIISLENIKKNCKKEKLFLLSAALFKPFMRASINDYTRDEHNYFKELIHYSERDVSKLKPRMRQHLMHMLNIITMLESPLFDLMTNEESNAHYINDVQSYKVIESLSTEHKALVIVGRWKKEGALNHAMTTCIAMLDRYNIRSFEWVEDDVRNLILYRLRNPRKSINPLDYTISLTAEDLLTGYGGEVYSKEIKIDEATLALTRQWDQEGILDRIIPAAKKALKQNASDFYHKKKPKTYRKNASPS